MSLKTLIDRNRASFYLAFSRRPFADGNARSNAAIYGVHIFSVQRTSFCNPRASTETDPEQSAIAQRLLRDILGLPTGAYTDVNRLEERMEKVALLVVDRLQEHTATMLGKSNAGLTKRIYRVENTPETSGTSSFPHCETKGTNAKHRIR